jgi:hypothetical protein
VQQIPAFHFCVGARTVTGSICGLSFFSLLALFRYISRGKHHFYFDAQDFFHYEGGGSRVLPISAKSGTFGTSLKGYVGATKLLITVAAASIAFGSGSSSSEGVVLAKIMLAFAILFGTIFVAVLQMFYEAVINFIPLFTFG